MAGVRRYANGVDELRDATGGCAANIYQFARGSVAYFARDFQEAGELTGDDLVAALRVQDVRGVAGGKASSRLIAPKPPSSG